MGEHTVPILPSRDLRESLSFYEALGFQNRGAPPEDWDYLIVGRGGLELHFCAAAGTDPLSTSASCYAFVDDADSLYEQWANVVLLDQATGSRLVPPVDTDYGMRELAVIDRSGNLVRVGSTLALDA